jgi:Ca-activated chloride channel homolog
MKAEKVIFRDVHVTKIFLIVLATFIGSVVLHAQDKSVDKTLSPYFLVKSENPEIDKLPLQSTSAKVTIAGVIADVSVNQMYTNEGQTALEAIYVFPASSNAAVYAMEMKIGDRTIVAKIQEKEKARKNYEKALKKGKRASLLEQLRPNVFQMNVGNIQPGDVITVNLKYTELLVPENGTYSFVYPTVVGPRFTYKNGVTENHNQPPYQCEGELPYYEFDLDVKLMAGLPVQSIICPTHQVEVRYNGSSEANIVLDELEIFGGNRDFILNYQLAGEAIESGLLLYEHKDEKFFLMIVQPPKQIKNADIPPREYIFIVDVSGSMHGFPIETSKTLMRNLVVNLKPTDKFNVLLFAGTSGWLSPQSVYATPENVENAIFFIDRQRGSGTTMLLPAMEKALKLPREDKSLSRSFVIVTDGYVSVEKEAFDLIRYNANQVNTFAFGIGSSVNRYLIEGLAHVGMSEPMIITEPSEAAEKASKFRNYISNPVLTQITTDFGEFKVYDVEPVSIPDVLAERPVIVFGKYKGEPKGKITVEGYTGKSAYKVSIDVNEVKPDEDNSALRYLWARKRIQLLDDYRRLTNGEDKEIMKLGLKYNLLTAYTSFVAIDTEKIENENGEMVTVEQPVPLPKGVSNYAVGCEMEIIDVDCELYEKSQYFKMAEVPKAKKTQKIVFLSSVAESLKQQLIADIESKIKKLREKCGISEKTLVRFSISKDGKVTGVIISSHNNAEIEDCIKEQILIWNFGQYKIKTRQQLVIKF